MSDTKEVLEKLITDHRGKANSITQSQLSDALGLPESTVRSELRRLREKREVPIANLRNGYYVIQTESEFREFIGHLNQEIESKRNTIAHTLEAWESFDGEIDAETAQEVQEQTYECTLCGEMVHRSEVRWPKQGEYEDQPLGKTCYGKLVVEGNA